MKPPSKSRPAKPKRASPVHDGQYRADLNIGRINQKLRTRDALVSAAAEFIRRGDGFSVADIADKAGVSRPTAYRYFATPELLHAQAALYAAGRIETSELDQLLHQTGSPEDKLDALIRGTDAMTVAHESEFRTLLRLSLDPGRGTADPVLRRPQFRRSWLSSALAELEDELGAPRFKRLIAALSLMCGIESFIVLQDILRLEPREATDVKRWAARLLLHAAIHEAADDRATISKPARPKAAMRKRGKT
jgi:AcrR family transcriptional regulator